jgi:hypothetical protein
MPNDPSPSNLRIGDAERAEMSDALGKHYSDGRLDEHEFRERMERAMAAKTQADLHGLLSDLPPLGQPPASPAGGGPIGAAAPPRHRHRGRAFQLALIVFLAIVVAHVLTSPWPFLFQPWPFVPLLVIGFLVFRRRRHHHHHHHWQPPSGPPPPYV